MEQNDPISSSPKFSGANKPEIDDLLRRNMRNVVKASGFPKYVNKIGGKFVLESKNFWKAKQKTEARFVVERLADALEEFIENNIPNLLQSPANNIVAASAVLGCRVALLYFIQECFKSKGSLIRKVYVKRRLEHLLIFCIEGDEFLELWSLYKPLWLRRLLGCYVLPVCQNELGMIPLNFDTSMYINSKEWSTIRLLGSCVDVILFSGGPDFNLMIEMTRANFESKPLDWNELDFLVIQIETKFGSNDTWFELSQRYYLDKHRKGPTEI